MKVAIVTDAWQPQVNGVVRTLGRTRDELVHAGHEVFVLTRTGRYTIPYPGYPEIPLVILPGRTLSRELDAFDPDAIHIATEGPLGLAARRYALAQQRPSRPRITRNFRNTCGRACRFPSRGRRRRCGGSTRRPCARWCRRKRSARSCFAAVRARRGDDLGAVARSRSDR